MDKLDSYRKTLRSLLQSYADLSQGEQDVETELIFDPVRDHYQLVHIGWQADRRIYGCVLHLNIKGEKIWIQHNGTEADIAEELLDRGVVKDDIVIGFHSPFKRQFTEYAVN
ncbi:MAG: XisI protein [Cyanobacteria bacterium J06634_6]